MEPVTTITAATIVSLAFSKFLEKSSDKLLEKFSEAAIGKMDQLRQLIWNRLRGNPRAETALTAAEQGSKPDLDRLAVYLEDEMKDDPQFAQQVQVIAKEIRLEQKEDNSRMVQNNYDNSTGYLTKTGEGNTNYFGGTHHHGTH